MTKSYIFVICLVVIGFLSVHVYASKELSIPVEKYQLENGLTVILRADNRLPKVAVNVWYHVGAGQEAEGRSGFAHLFEHLMFQGSKHVGRDKHFSILESIGATDVNGTTDLSRTNYFETVPSEYLERALWLESDRMGFLKSMVTQDILDEQRGVVKNERRQRIEYAPYQMSQMQAWNTVFQKGHPYHGNVIGSMEDLNAATLEDVYAFFDTYYTPANATLTLVGDFDVTQAKEWISLYFGELKGTPKPRREVIPAPDIKENLVIDVPESMGQFMRQRKCYQTPAFFKDGDADFDILSRVLTGQENSGLAHELVKEKQLVLQAHAYQRSMDDFSFFCFDLILVSPDNAEAAWKIVDDYVQKASRGSISADDIAIARAAFTVDRLFSLEQIGGSYGVADMLQMYDHYVGEPNYFAQDIERYDSVTPQTIADNVQRYIIGQPSVLLIARPQNQEPSK